MTCRTATPRNRQWRIESPLPLTPNCLARTLKVPSLEQHDVINVAGARLCHTTPGATTQTQLGSFGQIGRRTHRAGAQKRKDFFGSFWFYIYQPSPVYSDLLLTTFPRQHHAFTATPTRSHTDYLHTSVDWKKTSSSFYLRLPRISSFPQQPSEPQTRLPYWGHHHSNPYLNKEPPPSLFPRDRNRTKWANPTTPRPRWRGKSRRTGTTRSHTSTAARWTSGGRASRTRLSGASSA